jgi:hypothetical protein
MGLAAGALAWVLHQQVLADALRFNCAAVSPGRAMLALSAALLLCLGGAGISWYGNRTVNAGTGRRFVCWLSIVSAGIFALAIVMQAFASLTVPGCFR